MNMMIRSQHNAVSPAPHTFELHVLSVDKVSICVEESHPTVAASDVVHFS